MGRTQTIFVDPNELLRGIAAAEKAAADQLQQIASAEPTDGNFNAWQQAHRDLGWLKTYGIRCIVRGFFNRVLTPSEIIRAQGAVRELEAAGYIEVFGHRAAWVRMLPAGWAAIEAANK